jgi:hypothetical protein
MANTSAARAAAVGFVVKSGWAAAVLLHGQPDAPRIGDNGRVELCDPGDPDARQPYHAGFGTARANDAELQHLVESVRRFGHRSVTRQLHQYREEGFRLVGAGLVVGSTVDPSTIANDHIRIHALEGKLFREVVANAATGCGVACTIWRQRDLGAAATEALEMREAALKSALMKLKEGAGGPWRAEQKLAATAGWILLAGKRR